MKHYQLLSLVLLITAPVFVHRVDGKTKSVAIEEYTIYSTILNAPILHRQKEFPIKLNKGHRFVINNRTSGVVKPEWIADVGRWDTGLVSPRLKASVGDMLAKNQSTHSVHKKFALKHKYSLFSIEKFAEFFKKNGPVVGYEVFHQKYGKSSAFYTFSRVGFNSKHTKAVVYVAVSCSPICAYFRFVELNKLKGKWKITNEFG